jgi:putative CocE/NonD family hydrolase
MRKILLSLLIGILALEAEELYKLETLMTPMRDGVRLATDVYLPAQAQGRYPVLVIRSPYNKRGERGAAAYFTRYGYALVAQDCRGRYASEGRFEGLPQEGRDGYDTIEWAAAQPWSNGKVATLGASYLGWVQYNAAMFKPPHLVAMFVLVAGSNFFAAGRPGGAPGLPLWVLTMAHTSPAALKMPEVREKMAAIVKDPDPWLALPREAREKVLLPFPDYLRMYRDFYAHPTFDEFWRQPGYYAAGYYRQIKDVPIFFLTGWYDTFTDQVIENFLALSKIQKSMKRLLIGPWPHATGRARCGDAEFGPAAAVDQLALERDWFDHWMKGTPFGMVSGTQVRIFRMGGGQLHSGAPVTPGGQWRDLEQWPPAGAGAVRYYLNGTALTTSAPPPGQAPSSYEHDPAHPVPNRGHNGNRTCVMNQASLGQRADVLSFVSRVLDKPLDVTGPVRAALWIRSTAEDTDFIARLVDVYPDGYAMNLCEGVLRTSYREGPERLVKLVPGKVYKIAIEMGATSNLFASGHRIRLDIASSNFPKSEPHPLPARNTVLHDATHASFVELPVVPAP